MGILPPPLKSGDTIGVFAPSSWVEQANIEKSTAVMENLGYKVFVHPQTYEREHQSAGSHLQKALAFQGLWQRKDISAIWAAGGGNRCTHLLDTLNFERLKAMPKTLIGFSDITALLNTVYAYTDIVTYHGPVFKNLHTYQQMDHLLSLLAGEKPAYPVTADNILNEGNAEGHLIGGNLSVFQYLPQTLPDGFYDGAILFFEDCKEELSRMDRMLLHLKRLGVLKAAKGIIFGQFTDIPESGKPFGYSLTDIIAEHTEGMDIPILHNMPFGHGKDLYSLPVGRTAQIDTSKPELKLL